jgi:hypothetical protein
MTANPTTDTPPPRRSHRTLTTTQRALADDLGQRAERLWTDADGELSLFEAVALAAVQLGYFETPEVGDEPAEGGGA